MKPGKGSICPVSETQRQVGRSNKGELSSLSRPLLPGGKIAIVSFMVQVLAVHT